MCGKIRQDKIKNVNIRVMVGITSIEDKAKLRGNKLRLLEHIFRRPIDDSTRGRGRPKLTLDAIVKKDRIILNISKHLA